MNVLSEESAESIAADSREDRREKTVIPGANHMHLRSVALPRTRFKM